MSALPKDLQLDLLCEFQVLPEDLEKCGDEKFGTIKREGRKLYRYRCLDYRIYFEPHANGLLVHRVLHKNTLRDFLFRSELPMAEDHAEALAKAEYHALAEDEQVADAGAFWKLIDEAKQAGQ